MSLPNELRSALKTKTFNFAFDPIFCADGQNFNTFEFIPQFCHSVLGTVEYGGLRGVATAMGLDREFTLLFLEQACSELAHWSLRSSADMVLTVNVAARVIAGDGFSTEIDAMLTLCRIKPGQLRLRVNSADICNLGDVERRRLETVRSAGVGLVCDQIHDVSNVGDFLQDVAPDLININALRARRLLGIEAEVLRARLTADRVGTDIGIDGIVSLRDLRGCLELGIAEAQGPYFGGPVDRDVVKRLRSIFPK
jgi:EAL domain-containing protein (putative c-di-GMP-specific phosphodiesterase class I)